MHKERDKVREREKWKKSGHGDGMMESKERNNGNDVDRRNNRRLLTVFA